MFLEDILTLGVCLQNNTANFFVNLRCNIFRNCIGLYHITAEENFLLTAAVVNRSDQIAHAVLGDHALSHRGCSLNVVGSTGGNVIHRQLFCDTAAEQHNQIVQHLILGCVELLFLRQTHRKAACAAAPG